MSVMKAALPEEDLDMLTSPASLPVRPAAPAAGVAVAGGAAAAAAAAVKLPPGSLQLPTSFELLASPRPSARAVQVREEPGAAACALQLQAAASRTVVCCIALRKIIFCIGLCLCAVPTGARYSVERARRVCVLQEAMLAEEALPQQPSSLHRSPSVEELLRKVQCVDARQVGFQGGQAGAACGAACTPHRAVPCLLLHALCTPPA